MKRAEQKPCGTLRLRPISGDFGSARELLLLQICVSFDVHTDRQCSSLPLCPSTKCRKDVEQ